MDSLADSRGQCLLVSPRVSAESESVVVKPEAASLALAAHRYGAAAADCKLFRARLGRFSIQHVISRAVILLGVTSRPGGP